MNKYVVALVVLVLLGAGALYVDLFGVYTGPFFGANDRLTPTAAWHNADENIIVIETPKGGTSVPNPFVVSGKARGNWYFEASFPLYVFDQDGNELVVMPVQAQGDWMTTEFVPFSATVVLPEDFHGGATVIFTNDNASGLPEHDRAVSIPIWVE